MNRPKTTALIGMLGIMAVALTISVGCGCKTVTTVTTNPDGTTVTNVTKTLDAARAASVSRQAAEDATVFLLSKGQHPEWLPQFQIAESDLRTLAVSPSPSLNDLMSIVQRLPVKQLQGSYAQISFEAADIALSAIDIPTMSATAASDVKSIAQALADGIAAGIAQLPQTPAPTNSA